MNVNLLKRERQRLHNSFNSSDKTMPVLQCTCTTTTHYKVAELITGNHTPSQTAAQEQCWAVWGTVTPPYCPRASNHPPQSSQTTAGRATDHCSALIGSRQCCVVMGVVWLASYLMYPVDPPVQTQGAPVHRLQPPCLPVSPNTLQVASCILYIINTVRMPASASCRACIKYYVFALAMIVSDGKGT